MYNAVCTNGERNNAERNNAQRNNGGRNNELWALELGGGQAARGKVVESMATAKDVV